MHRMMYGSHKSPTEPHHSAWAPLAPPNGSSRVLDWGLSQIFDVKTRGDARTQQYDALIPVRPLWQ
jgi:hypothetical protein